MEPTISDNDERPRSRRNIMDKQAMQTTQSTYRGMLSDSQRHLSSELSFGGGDQPAKSSKQLRIIASRAFSSASDSQRRLDELRDRVVERKQLAELLPREPEERIATLKNLLKTNPDEMWSILTATFVSGNALQMEHDRLLLSRDELRCRLELSEAFDLEMHNSLKELQSVVGNSLDLSDTKEKEAAQLKKENEEFLSKNTGLEKELEERQGELRKTAKDMAHLHDVIATAEKAKKQLNDTIEERDKKIRELTRTIDQLTEIRRSNEQKLSDARDEVVTLTMDVKERDERISKANQDFEKMKRGVEEVCMEEANAQMNAIKVKMETSHEREMSELTVQLRHSQNARDKADAEVRRLKEQLRLLALECLRLREANKTMSRDAKAKMVRRFYSALNNDDSDAAPASSRVDRVLKGVDLNSEEAGAGLPLPMSQSHTDELLQWAREPLPPAPRLSTTVVEDDVTRPVGTSSNNNHRSSSQPPKRHVTYKEPVATKQAISRNRK